MGRPDTAQSELARRARRAYELGRIRHAVGQLWPLVPSIAVAVFFGEPSTVLWFGTPLVVLSCALLFIGRGFDRAALAGWRAGIVPLAVALGTAQRFGCTSPDCAAWCVPLCAVAGTAVGAWLGFTMRARERVAVAAASLVVAGLTASIGCAAIGLGTMMGAVAGLCVGLVPVLVYRHASQA